jgi:hypothetical protein
MLLKVASLNSGACRFYEAMAAVADPKSLRTTQYLGAPVETVTYELQLTR